MRCRACDKTLAEREQKFNERMGNIEDMCNECILAGVGISYSAEHGILNHPDNLFFDEALFELCCTEDELSKKEDSKDA
jgi:hypothetical protein